MLKIILNLFIQKILSQIGGKDVLKSLLKSGNESMQQITLKAMSIQAVNDEDIGTVKVVILAISYCYVIVIIMI